MVAVLIATLGVGVVWPVAIAGPANAATGNVTGTVYNDYDNDGVLDSGEPGVAGATIYGYDSAGAQFGPATTDANGNYTLAISNSATSALRIELQGIPTGYQPTRAGTNNATTIRFETLSGSSLANIHFGIQKPGDYCQNNPSIATTVMCQGDGLNSMSTGFHNVFEATYDSQTRTASGLASLVQSVNTVAWNPVNQQVYIAAYVKRHAGLVTDADGDGTASYGGADALWVMNPATNTTQHWVDLATLGINVGQSAIPNNTARNIVSSTPLSQDPIFGEVGKYGIGDIETNNVDTLYVTNLFQRTVHAIPIPSNGSAPTTSSSLGTPGSAVTCTNGTARPFALAYQDGYLYSGIVCDAATGTTADLDAYVVRTPASGAGSGTWAQYGPKIDLDYNKGAVYTIVDSSTSSARNKWHAWDDTIDSNWDAGANSSASGSFGGGDFVVYPMPMLSDIEFDDNGSMILAFRDRGGDMVGQDNSRPDAADSGTPAFNYNGTNPLVNYMAGGDLLRVCNNAGTWVIDGASSACSNHTTTGAVGNNNEGPNNGEYYAGEESGNHDEISMGHVAVVPRSGQLLLSAMNAVANDTNSGGIRGLNNTNGSYISSLSAEYYFAERPAFGSARFGKANGMGDVEALCDAAPLEIGNRVFQDTDGDGIQDAGEPGINGVTVQLYDAAGTTLLGTAVTSGSGNAAGQYFFRTGLSEAAAGNGDNVGGGLSYRAAFQIRIGTATNYASGGVLDNMGLTTPNASPVTTYAGNQDTIDSDPVASGTPGNMGSSWFPTIAVTAGSTLPGFNNHTYDAGFIPPAARDLALRKTFVSMSGTPSSGTVTFRLEIFNQTANGVNDVTVTDYIDTASFAALTSAPASGTTGGSVALPYSWSISGGGATGTTPKLLIDGVIPGNSSVTVDVTLTIAQPIRMAGLRNWAEISVFDTDGNPDNGDSTSGAVYDVDSIPDATNTDTLQDDTINLQRWTNTATTQTENTGVLDEDDHDIATVPVYDIALIKTRSAGQASTITTPSTTASFDITVKNQSQSQVFNVTVLDSPTSPLAINSGTPASQTVTSSLGNARTVTFSGGTFTVPTLLPNESVTFQVLTTLALTNSVQVNTAEITGFDNDSNGANVKPSYVQDLDSTPDTNPLNDVLQANGSVFAIDSHNTIDNPPVNGTNANDEDDHDSEGVQLGLLRIGSTVYKDANGNDVGDAGEEVPGVLVQLFRFNGSSWILAGETVTNAGGDYSFDQLYPGTYQVGIPTTQSHGTLTGINSTALNEWEPVPGAVTGPETSNFDNDGDAESGFISRSDDIVLTYNGEPTNDDADDADADALTSPRTYTDANSNLNIDFVFEQIVYELGNLVWADGGAGANYDNGIANSDESGIAGVTVELYRDNGAGAGSPNDGLLHVDERIATTTTNASGFYRFTGLVAGSDYYVVVVKSTLPAGYAVAGTPVTVGAANGIDNDNNAAINLGDRWASGAIALGPVSSPEPTGETDGTTGTDAQPTETVADNRADQTIDFGFVPTVRIGNQVWRDESDTDPTTEVATDNDGIFNATERGLAGVTVQLWRDVNTNGTFERSGADASGLVATTSTNAEGNYWFEDVRPGIQYFVVIPSLGSVGVDRPASSTGQSASATAADNVDDGAPVGNDISVSGAFTPTLGGASLAEADAIEPGDGSSTADATAEAEANAAPGSLGYDDNDSELRIDFGFVSVPVYRVGNLVWLDNGGSPRVAADERDGAADANEAGIAGVTVSLYSDNGNNAYGAGDTLIGTAVTDANGKYAFENLVAGNYFVVINSADGSNATLLAGLTSTTDGAAANADADNDDNGIIATGGWASSVVTLGAANNWLGGEPTNETLRNGVGTDDDNGASWTATTSDPAVYADTRSNFSVDFGFAPVYRLGNLVWLDSDNDGTADSGETGLAGVTVRLLNPTTGAELATTTTDSNGRYVFTDLVAGNYAVQVVPATLPAYVVPGGVTVSSADGNVDNDNNAASPASPLGPYAATVTLGGAEPTNEVTRNGSGVDDDNDTFSDAASNYTVDFGFWAQLRLGNVVWIDESDNNPATYSATDNNGVLDAGETLLENVTVSVWRDGGNGVFDAGTGGGDDTFAGSDVTDAEGNWLVAPLAPGVYFAAIQTLPAPYAAYVSSLGQSSTDADNNDNGAAGSTGAGTPFVSVSTAISLTAGNEPTGESDTLPAADGSAETEATTAAGYATRDSDSNLTVDFGFIAPPQPYDLALRKTFVSMTGTPESGNVTFQIEVFNQGVNSVNDLVITDYIDTASFLALTSAPASGTTGGDAALPYSWSIAGGGASGTTPKLSIDGVIPAGDSVTVQLTLTTATPVRMAGLRNWAEISVFDNDGNPSNGDSTTGAVYDVDSIPDATNDDELTDDEIDEHRWTNTSGSQTENTSVTDEDDHDIATVPVYDLALIKTRAAGQDAIVTSPATTATFDITVKNQGLADVYGVTVLDSPTSPLAVSSSTAASQTVTTALGATVTVTFDSGTGVFTIPALAAGDSVTFQVVADLALVNTVQVNTAEITGFDNDTDTGNAKPSYVQDVDSTPDGNPLNDVLQANGTVFPIDSHNSIDNPPVSATNPSDEDDHDSEGVQLGLLRIGSTVYKDANGNHLGDAGEEVPGVLVQLFRHNGSGWDLVGETVTDANGDYSFDRLFPGTYQVGIPTAQSHGTLTGIDATALDEWQPVVGAVTGPETDNFDNDGDAEAGFISRSDDIVLTYDGEPTNDDADDADADALTSPRTYTDANSNLNIDFVFEQFTYEIGNLVWADGGAGVHYNNGVADDDEFGIPGVTVELYRDNGAGAGIANDGVLHPDERIATDTTDASGFYAFTSLVAGDDYYMVVVKSSVPAGHGVAGTPVAAASDVDNDNNAFDDVTFGWSSGVIGLGPVTSPEPTGETDGTTGADAFPAESVADARANQTVDFGFVPTVRIGNQVWRDESDANPATEVATDNDGIFNGAERGLAGVTVELWLDVDTDGVFEPAGDDASGQVDSTVTDSEGNYWFEGVRPDVDYFVAIASIGSLGDLDAASSTGQSAVPDAADNDDDGAPAAGYLSVSHSFTPRVDSATEDEDDAIEPGDGASTADADAEVEANAASGSVGYDDNDSELTIDFGFVSVPVYRVGNLVWLDNGGSPFVASDEADGIADGNEPGIPGVTVALYADNGATAGSLDGGDTLIGTAVTDADGKYAFENLVSGDYLVFVSDGSLGNATLDGSNATLLSGLVSTQDGASADADVDNDDNGVVASGGWSSDSVTLGAANNYMGGEPVNERLRSGSSTNDDDGLSWTAAGTDPAVYANSRSNFTVDFGFAAVYRLGNLVWLDSDNDGVADVGEAGLSGVSVQLLETDGSLLATTTTDADGHYLFTDLPAGTYAVRVVPSSLPAGVVPGGVTVGNANNDVDNDNNAASPASPLSAYAATVTLGGAEPTNEVLRNGSATDDDNDTFADAASNVTVDFGFWPQLRLGNVVWIDESDANPATYAVTDNNGVLDAGETLLENVTVSVWRDGGDGVFDAGSGSGDDTLAGSDVTDAEGNWVVAPLAPGVYFAAIQTLPAPYASYVSSLGQFTSAADNNDNGTAGSSGAGVPFVSVSNAITLTAGTAPTGEVDARPAADGSAETEATANAGFGTRDSDSNLTIDFSFVAPPTYRIGNLVWRDTDRDGVADAGEPGISGVLVQLLNGAGTVVNETVTDANGAYAFTTTSAGAPLTAGDYRVRIPSSQVQTLGLGLTISAGALSNLSATGFAGDPDTVVVDNDSNGDTVAGGWQSPLVTLGGGTVTYETEPTLEVHRNGGDDDLGWASGTDARSEFTVDFGFFPGLRLGDTVWFDDGRTGPSTTNPLQDDDGIYQATELPAADVTVLLFEDDGDGVFEPGADDGSAVQSVTTDAAGEYFFIGLDESVDYWVAIPDSEQNSGNELEGYRASTPVFADGAGTNDRNHGTAASGYAAVSPLVDLTRGGMAYGDAGDEGNADVKTAATIGDADSNLVIDFGFSPEPLYRIGNLVWLDGDESGVVDSGEAGIGGVTVQLFEDDGDGVFEPGVGAGRDGAPVASDTTGTTGVDLGRYGFDGLTAGSYWVYLPSQSALDGMDSSEIRNATANDDADNDNNAIPDATNGGWAAGLVQLGAVGAAGENDEPTGETDGNTSASAEDGLYLDGRSNQTVDFGFNYRLRVGNQVWRDESDANPATSVATDNNGTFDAGEVGIAAVPVQLWYDVDGDGFEGASSDDALVDSTFTDAEGNYWFDGIVADADFYVAIPVAGFPLSDVRSSAGQSADSLAGDNVDDGAPAGSYLSLSRMLDLTVGGAATAEADAVEPGNGVGVADATAEVEANVVAGTYRDIDSYLRVDFGFINVPLYRVGNLVWLDSDNDGIAESGEPGIEAVLVQLLDSGGSVVAETITDADGHYVFQNLPAGDYSVRIRLDQVEALGGSLAINPAALDNLASSTTTSATPNNNTDNDDNGVDVAAGWQSGTITLGAGPDAGTETEPTSETLRSGVATDDDSGWSAGTDGRSNVTVDFGFYQLRLGDIVWLDNGGNGGAYVASREDDGRFQEGFEDLIDGVTVNLYLDDNDGVFEPGADDALVGTTETSGGRYYFTGLVEGTYFAAIPDTELGEELADLRSSTGQFANFGSNDRDQGAPATGWAAMTRPIVMDAGTMVNGDTAYEGMADAITGITVANRSSNLAVDFGFSPVPAYALGNLVWEDLDNDGVADAGEPGIGGVTVQLYRDLNTSGAIDAGDVLVATDTTGTTGADRGRYLFEDLTAGDYLVHVPSQATLNGWYVGGTPTGAADVDNDNNALTDATDGWTSPAVTLGGAAGPADHNEPTGETDGTTGADAEAPVAIRDDRSNQTIDFGFWRGLRLGNQVWRDESDGDASTSAATDNNGAFDSGELGIAGVAVELWIDVNGDGFQGASSDDQLVETVVTDAEGNYTFDHLNVATTYFVAIENVGAPLSTARSSGGQSAAFDAGDNDDDGDPLSGYLSVSNAIVLTVGGATLGEADTVEPGSGVGVGDVNAEVEADAVTGPYRDEDSFLTADFGFIEVPLYRIGNLVWLDADNDGIAEVGESPIEGVLVQLLSSTGVVIAETVTDADGHYEFENLAAGTYHVQIPENQTETLAGSLAIDSAALDNLAASTVDATNADDDVDNDDNGVWNGAAWRASSVVLGDGNPSVTETESTSERLRSGSATDDDLGWTGGTDARSNVTVDFGFYQLLRLGDLVWLDNGGTGLSYNAADEDDGEWDAATEPLIDGVEVRLYSDGGDGVFNPGDVASDDSLVATTSTSNGIYYFTGLVEGDYWVAIPDADLADGRPLDDLRSSTGRAANDSVNSLDQGEPETGFASVSQLVTLVAGGMSNGDSADESRADTDTGITVADASSNLAIDFGFSPVPTYAVGNVVWEDYDNDGVQDSGEVGIPGVTVELYRDVDADGIIDSGEPLVGTTTTSAGVSAGRYVFEDLAAGDYLVHVPSQAALDGWFVSGSPNDLADVDNDNNALTDATDGWTSPTVTLGGAAGPADHNEPTGETDGIDGADAELAVTTRDDRSNQTYDFGFWRGLRLGNQVWSDEGAGANQDNGIYDADESPLAGVTVELWADDGDGSWDELTDTLVDTTSTDAQGRYFFTQLPEGDYFVAIESAGAAAVSSTGTVGSGLADDGEDDGAPAGTYQSVSGLLELTLGGAPVGETDGPGATTDSAETYANGVTGVYPDGSSYLTADFGFIGAPVYRIGNLVWNDADNDGAAESGEPGIDGVLVQLTDGAGTVIAETVTSGGGKYSFANLVAGSYRVQIPTDQVPDNAALAPSIVAGAISGMFPSTTPDPTADNDEDNDANGVVVASLGAQSGLVTLGGSEPTTEQLRANDATDDDAGLVTPRIDDDRSNFTVDFGYYSISLGNLVFSDTDGDGVFEPADGDAGIDDVTVELRDASDALVSTTTTAGGGQYLFTGLEAGVQYYVQIPAAEFAVGGDLEGVYSSPGDAGTVASTDVDGLDRGVDAAAYAAVRSNGLWTATASAAPITDGTGDNPDNDAIRPDAAENLVIDFGFYAMELGGTLFRDSDNDGIDTDEADFAGVTVLLYEADGDPFLRADGSQATTTTDGNGDYRFTGLPEGDYIVEIPASQFAVSAVLGEFANSDGNDPVPSPENDVTGEDNGYPVSGDIFSRGAVRSEALTLAVSSEPTDDPNPTAGYPDAQSNLTVDFGFWNAQGALELGNQLWFDTTRNGVFDATETAVPAGVELELRDADTDALIATTFTDSNGRYLFGGLKAGRYVVKVTAANFLPGRPLAGYTSTDGSGVSADPNDENDSDSNALPLTVTGVRSGMVVLSASTPVGEVDPASVGLDDRQSNLTVDFGFVRAPVLVFTGADAAGAIRFAVLLLLLGAMMVVAARRREDESEA